VFSAKSTSALIVLEELMQLHGHVPRFRVDSDDVERTIFSNGTIINHPRQSMLERLGQPSAALGFVVDDPEQAARETMELFRKNGYASLRAGKIYHGGLDDDRAWTSGGEPLQEQKPRTPEQNAQRQKQSDRWEAVEGGGERLPDYRTAGAAIDYLEKNRDNPFFLAVGFVKPHSFYQAPKSCFDLYDASTLPLPKDFAPRPTVGPGVTVELILSSGPPEFAIPDIEGIDASIATRVLQASGLTIRRTDSVANALPKGVAFATRAAAGTTRPASEPIDLVVSAGPANAAIPDVSNLTILEARERLFAAGFNIGRIVFERSEGLPEGRIIRQRPAAGERVAKDGRVDLIVVGEPE
jgi:hypothetical protein